ncbi:MAG: gamma-glutamyl-gamma-aminobutyrate hydrolase family protein, partial [Treponema sp.]|nr:gamma-glutamyl-gamma-aminobutyrate hydrolase family protein [Treponema sp.]
MDKILILDFGSQTTQLIGRRIRDLGVYTEIIPGDAPLDRILDSASGRVKGIVLSGSPESVYTSEGAAPVKELYGCGLPLLGICYGLQRMNHDRGGIVEPLPEREYGAKIVSIAPGALDGIKGENGKRAAAFLGAFGGSITAWMSHGDTLTKLAPGFREAGKSATGYPAVVIHETESWFGLQFHPEAAHCERGREILSAFVFAVCGCGAGWTMERYIRETGEGIAERVGKNEVLLLVSGGVDSTVAGALLLKTLDPRQVHLMYMDTGLMRKDETAQVKATLEKLGAAHLH